jgi:nucleotide-binding universal stress UspA family protein
MSSPRRSAAERPLIVCHDGSQEATDALDYAATLFPRARVLILTLWKPLVEEALAPAARPPASDPAESGDLPRRAASEIAAEAARRAEVAGLEARALALEARGALWQTVETVADEHDALLVVCGTNRTGMRTALPGSLATALVMHLSRPVLVVPSAKAAADRRREAEGRHRAHGPFAAQRR